QGTAYADAYANADAYADAYEGKLEEKLARHEQRVSRRFVDDVAPAGDIDELNVQRVDFLRAGRHHMVGGRAPAAVRRGAGGAGGGCMGGRAGKTTPASVYEIAWLWSRPRSNATENLACGPI